ncbi:hypothetical protein CR513_19045, partial [Mucuna pruriens]
MSSSSIAITSLKYFKVRPMIIVLSWPMEASFDLKVSHLKKNSSIRELLVKEAHEGGLMGHFGMCKTYKGLCEHYYWPKMRCDMHHIC